MVFSTRSRARKTVLHPALLSAAAVLLTAAACAVPPAPVETVASEPPEAPAPASPGTYPSGEVPSRPALPDYRQVPDLETVWELDIPEPITAPFAHDREAGRIYLGTRGGTVLAVESESGTLVWLHDAVGEVSSAPAFDDERVYVGFREPGGAVGLDTSSGRQDWRSVAVGWVARDPVFLDGAVLFISDYDLLALSPETGERYYRYELPLPLNTELTSLRRSGGSLIGSFVLPAGDGGGLLLLRRIRSGRIERLNLGFSPDRLASAAADELYLAGPAFGATEAVLGVVDLDSWELRESLHLQEGSRLLGALPPRGDMSGGVALGTVPPGMLLLDRSPGDSGLSRRWYSRRIHPGETALAWSPSGLEGGSGLVVSGRGVEGLVVYDSVSGDPLFHFPLEPELSVRFLSVGPERVYLLVSSAGGTRGRLIALATDSSAADF